MPTILEDPRHREHRSNLLNAYPVSCNYSSSLLIQSNYQLNRFQGSEDDEELCALASQASDSLPERSVEKVLNLARNNPAPESGKQLNASLDMLLRVFPFESKRNIETILSTCDGDVAKAVQHLVGQQSPENPTKKTSLYDQQAPVDKTIPLLSGAKSAFHPTLPQQQGSHLAISNLVPDLLNQQASPLAATSHSPFNFNLPALRMMYNPGMMPFLHPSYFPNPSSWIMPPHRAHHVCSPGCCQCPTEFRNRDKAQQDDYKHRKDASIK